ncbi:SMEK domain-containing protein [Pseudoflavitalea sp. G-6-1-2]|uniref:SMEK domain-containing protein n=1 Tax=Pseudoflavitalea sp. G-6-1-2 TaxID=2728841 RepID=UPI00146E7D44|nr:SMEK domain-containing protein [Pseudoflavitalea sp. G-6-1-2]NML20018.1 SMEK domain-containing protein [Pseudoflavitalea sp. G-6-1-2]
MVVQPIKPPIASAMIQRKTALANIISKLSYLKSEVEISNPLNFTDINIISENFFRDFLNLLFGYSLENLNMSKANADAIDLGDETSKICFQVTSTSALAKTKKTVTGFIKMELYKKYDRLVILNIASKSNHRDPKIGDPQKFELCTQNDIWDISTLLKEIQDIQDVGKLEKISNFLDAEIKFGNGPSVPKEITTFMSLISFLSDEAQPGAGQGFIEEPDPDKKVYNRFSDHASYLTSEYQNLYIEYGLVLTDVLKISDIGQVRIRRLGLHLKNESDRVLTEQKNDPKLAIDALTDRYESVLRDKGLLFDRSAIRFFLLDQLIKCNVFPNKAIIA